MRKQNQKNLWCEIRLQDVTSHHWAKGRNWRASWSVSDRSPEFWTISHAATIFTKGESKLPSQLRVIGPILEAWVVFLRQLRLAFRGKEVVYIKIALSKSNSTTNDLELGFPRCKSWVPCALGKFDLLPHEPMEQVDLWRSESSKSIYEDQNIVWCRSVLLETGNPSRIVRAGREQQRSVLADGSSICGGAASLPPGSGKVPTSAVHSSLMRESRAFDRYGHSALPALVLSIVA
nr:hypothetical protein Iba_chr05bCG9570 [Ipomoea batatas]